MLSDIQNLDVMLDENHLNGTERDESLDNTSIRKHESVASNNLENEGESSYSNHRNSNVRTNAEIQLICVLRLISINCQVN